MKLPVIDPAFVSSLGHLGCGEVKVCLALWDVDEGRIITILTTSGVILDIPPEQPLDNFRMMMDSDKLETATPAVALHYAAALLSFNTPGSVPPNHCWQLCTNELTLPLAKMIAKTAGGVRPKTSEWDGLAAILGGIDGLAPKLVFINAGASHTLGDDDEAPEEDTGNLAQDVSE